MYIWRIKWKEYWKIYLPVKRFKDRNKFLWEADFAGALIAFLYPKAITDLLFLFPQYIFKGVSLMSRQDSFSCRKNWSNKTFEQVLSFFLYVSYVALFYTSSYRIILFLKILSAALRFNFRERAIYFIVDL